MTKSLELAFHEASRLPEPEQDALAEAIRSEIMGEEDWVRSFADSPNAFERLADEAIAESRAGRTHRVKPTSIWARSA